MLEQKTGFVTQAKELIRELGMVARLAFDPRTDPFYEQFVLRRRIRRRGIEEGSLVESTTLLGKVREVFEDLNSAIYGSNRNSV